MTYSSCGHLALEKAKPLQRFGMLASAQKIVHAYRQACKEYLLSKT